MPQTTYALVDRDGRALGEIRLRPHLTPPFEQHNGHIGYNVRPGQRGKGYATRMLALALDQARALGLERVMLPVEGENPASVRVIVKNGGILERSGVDQAPASLFRFTGSRSEGSRRRMGVPAGAGSRPPSDTPPRRGRARNRLCPSTSGGQWQRRRLRGHRTAAPRRRSRWPIDQPRQTDQRQQWQSRREQSRAQHHHQPTAGP